MQKVLISLSQTTIPFVKVDLLPERVVKQSAEGKEEEVEVKNKLTTEQYTVKVHTGDKFGAGTDANCYIRYT